MHRISIPKSVVDRVISKRGRAYVYENIEPSKTAFVVIDMQNAFLMPGVAHSVCAAAQDIVPNINELAQAIRATGGVVVWIKTTTDAATEREWSVYFTMVSVEHAQRRRDALRADSLGHQLWRDLDVHESDWIVEKTRYSAFLADSSNLAERLRARGIDTVLIGGTMTNVCCESSARDSMMLNFNTIMVTDGNAALTDDDHNASLASFYLSFGDIMSTEKLVGILRQTRRA